MFVNLTKHVIRIKGRSTETRQEEIREVQPSGQVATCRPLMGESQAQRLDQFEFYTSSRSLGEVLLSSGQPFPEPAEGTIYLVSSMVQGAMPRKDVQAPDTGPTAIRDAQGMYGPWSGSLARNRANPTLQHDPTSNRAYWPERGITQ